MVQLLTSSSPVEKRYYNVKDLDLVLVGYRCGEELDEDAIKKFNEQKRKNKLKVVSICQNQRRTNQKKVKLLLLEMAG